MEVKKQVNTGRLVEVNVKPKLSPQVLHLSPPPSQGDKSLKSQPDPRGSFQGETERGSSRPRVTRRAKSRTRLTEKERELRKSLHRKQYIFKLLTLLGPHPGWQPDSHTLNSRPPPCTPTPAHRSHRMFFLWRVSVATGKRYIVAYRDVSPSEEKKPQMSTHSLYIKSYQLTSSTPRGNFC